MERPLKEYDVVRVRVLREPTREFSGTEGVSRPPRVGDIGTIVHEYRPIDPEAPVVVEMVAPDGNAVWIADFTLDELELVERERAD